MQRLKFIYKKGDKVKFVSHLDHMRAFERAVRRAGLPVSYSQGFNPRPKISYLSKALKVGEGSDVCEAEITLTTWLNPGKARETLNKFLPEGFEVVSMYAV